GESVRAKPLVPAIARRQACSDGDGGGAPRRQLGLPDQRRAIGTHRGPRLYWPRLAPEVRPDISVVIPLFNEAENVDDLYRELSASLTGLGRPYEIILVDDGSEDGTLDRLLRLEARDRRVRVLRLRRNFGQTAAFSAGFDHSRGNVIVTSDG